MINRTVHSALRKIAKAHIYDAVHQNPEENAGIGSLQDNGVKFAWYDWLLPGMQISNMSKRPYNSYINGTQTRPRKYLAQAVREAGLGDTDQITVGVLNRARELQNADLYSRIKDNGSEKEGIFDTIKSWFTKEKPRDTIGNIFGKNSRRYQLTARWLDDVGKLKQMRFKHGEGRLSEQEMLENAHPELRKWMWDDPRGRDFRHRMLQRLSWSL